jgi:hypothetical protein
MSRVHKAYFTNLSLAADSDLTLAQEISVGERGYIGLQIRIHNGAGAAPSDTPIGVWELHCNAIGPGGRFTQVVRTILTTELAYGAAVGNTLVDAWCIVAAVPGALAKLKYKRTSGGASSARADVAYSTW